MVEIDALIRSTKLPLQTDQIVGVSLKHWTVKPSRAKRLITPANERVNSPEWGSHDDRAEEEGSASGSSEVTGAPTLGYICRPSHRQPPHCGECSTHTWGDSLISGALMNSESFQQFKSSHLWALCNCLEYDETEFTGKMRKFTIISQQCSRYGIVVIK